MKLTFSGRVRLTPPGACNGMRFYGLLIGKWAIGWMREETEAERTAWEESPI